MPRRGRRGAGAERLRRETGGQVRPDRRPRSSRPLVVPGGGGRRGHRGRRSPVEHRSLVLTRYHAIMIEMARTTTSSSGEEQLDLVDGIDELAAALRTLR